MLVKRTTATSSVSTWSLGDLGNFYSTNKASLVAHAARLLNDSVRAEEVVQEALLKIILAAPELKSEEHARAYVYRTVQNICMDIFRCEGRRPSLVVLDNNVEKEIDRLSVQLDSDFSEALTKAEDFAIVRQAISLLSPAERAALVMWEIEERSASEIAQELGIKESSVRHTIARARASMRRILSTIIIDESRGLTGLDLLSSTYGRAKNVAKKTSKLAFSLVILIFAIVGFNSPPLNEVSQLQGKENTQTATFLNSMPVNASVPTEEFANPDPTSPVQSNSSKVIQEKLRFPGLNKFGLPTGFTVADSTGALGTAYFRERTTSSPSSYLSTSQIIKTESGAANIFIAQNVSSEGNQIGYSPSVSFGKSGEWAPLLVSVTKSETRRLSDGNHLFTAYIAVQSEVESPIRITAKANGRDLDVAPSRVITRLVLDPSRTIVLSQAIYVIESKAGA